MVRAEQATVLSGGLPTVANRCDVRCIQQAHISESAVGALVRVFAEQQAAEATLKGSDLRLDLSEVARDRDLGEPGRPATAAFRTWLQKGLG